MKLVGRHALIKSMNFKVQFSPRFSAIGTYKEHTSCFSQQQVFRTPTLQNQYIPNSGARFKLLENLHGAKDMM